MIELVTDPFDSELWNKKVCKAHIADPFTEEELRAALARERPDIVFAFAPFSSDVMVILSRTGFRLLSLRSTYFLPREVEVEEVDVPPGFSFHAMSEGAPASDDDIRAMAENIGMISRYFRDRRIPREDAIRLYVAWIRNSLFHGYADKAFLILRDGRMAGIVTLKIKDGTGMIDLIGVLPSFQGRGLGRLLLTRAVQWLRSTGVSDIAVVTEGEDIGANVFYQRNGFIIRNFESVFHAYPTYE